MRLPWVSRRTFDKAIDLYDRTESSRMGWANRARNAASQRELARQQLDSVLVVLGMLDSGWIDAEPGREAAVLADFNYRLACAVQFRETEQAGGMMGTGYINGRVEAAKAKREQTERNLP